MEARKKTLTKTQIAEAIGCSKSNLSQGRYKGMPKFYSLDEFREWDQAARLRPSVKNPVESQEGKGGRKFDSGELDRAAAFSISWEDFAVDNDEFVGVTLRRCEQVSHMAYGLLDRMVRAGDIPATFGAVKNYAAALKEVRALRDEFLQVQKDERAVIALDEVKHVVGMVIQEIVAQMEASAPRAAGIANPDDPVRALNAFQGALDHVRMGVVGSLKRIESELGAEPGEVEEAEVCQN